MDHAEPSTPTRAHAQPTITAEQKQKLIDNLQIEVTTRARALRANYAQVGSTLRVRVERRIARIPASLRNANMGVLVDKYSESLEEKRKLPNVPVLSKAAAAARLADRGPPVPPKNDPSPARSRGVKRTSDEMTNSDKENQATNDLSNPKKRARLPGATAGQTASKPSRKIDPSTVLSPKTNNSRAIPNSPVRPGLPRLSPTKAMAPPPAKARAASKAAAAPRTRKAPVKGRVATERPVQDRTVSAASTSSAATVVTKKAPVKKGIVQKVTGMAAGVRGRATKKETTTQPADTGRRVLRSRKA